MRHVLKWGVLAAGLALLVSACARHVEPESIQSEINDALKDARIDSVQPIWDAERREMKLRGIAFDADEKRQAEQVAASALRDRGRVVNELVITMRGAPEAAPVVAESDDLEQIDARVHKDVDALFADKTVWKGRDIHIVVRSGIVHLTGTAMSQADKDRITEMVGRVAGVKEVINRLQVKNRKTG